MQQQLETIPRHPRVPLPRKNDQELRSYHFFLDVTAPAIAGVFDVDFWLTDIPRTCHLDPAIWHAVVSLGAVHENCIASRGAVEGPTTMFAMQQFNAAIRHLVHLSSWRTVPEERWRTLTASILFIYVCGIQGFYSQSIIHLTAAKNLMEEFDRGRARQSGSETTKLLGSNAATAPGQPSTSLVSYELLLSIVANLENHSQVLQTIGVNVAPAFLGEVDVHTAWRYYSAPTQPGSSNHLCSHGKCVPSRATPANLARAGRAFESLLNALMALSQQNSTDVARVILKTEHSLVKTLIHRQEPYARAFRELDAAICMFVTDTTGECLCFESATPSAPIRPQKKAIDALRLYHATCYPILLDKPPSDPPAEIPHPLLLDKPPPSPPTDGALPPPDPQAAITRHFSRALDIAESVLQDESRHARTAASDFTPALPTTLPLFIIAHVSGLTLALRRRVIALLRQYPRREVVWDSLFAAALAELVMEQESAPAGKARDRDGACVEERDQGGDEAQPVTPRKVYGVGVTFTGARSARVVMQTWAEWVANEPGREVVLTW